MTLNFEQEWVANHRPTKPEFDQDGTVIAAVDWLGNRFAVGENVLYCIGASRGQMMAIGEVIKIKCEVKTRSFLRDPLPGETPTSPYGVRDMLPYNEISVLVRTEKTSGRWDNTARSKPAWVNPMNITSLTGLRHGRRNTHCSNCGDERGGPIGHEISECQMQEADR